MIGAAASWRERERVWRSAADIGTVDYPTVARVFCKDYMVFVGDKIQRNAD
jgi:hypothetical protein